VTLLGVRYQRRQLLFVLGDVIIALLAIWWAHVARVGPDGLGDLPDLLSHSTGASLIFVSSNLLALYVAEAYEPAYDFRKPYLILRLALAVAVAAVVQMVAYYALPMWWWGRGITLFSNVFLLVAVVSWRMLICWRQPQLEARERTLVLGANEGGRLIVEELKERWGLEGRYEVLGFLHDDPGQPGAPTDPLTPLPLPALGTTVEVDELVHKLRVDSLIVAINSGMNDDLTKQLLACKSRGVRIRDMRTVYKDLTGKVPIHYLSDTSLIFGPEFAGTSWFGRTTLRLLDVAIALVGLILAAPILAVAAAAVKLTSPGPAFYTQERLGLNEQPFDIVKLRTMRNDAEAKTGPTWSEGQGDPRVTPVGRFLRRSRIDELPQLYNVLKGDMSMIGPRPEREHFVRELEQAIPFYGLRHAVKPGVTGWAQVKYRYGASVEDAAEKLCYDLFAVQELSPMLYLIILLKTVQTVLVKPGS